MFLCGKKNDLLLFIYLFTVVPLDINEHLITITIILRPIFIYLFMYFFFLCLWSDINITNTHIYRNGNLFIFNILWIINIGLYVTWMDEYIIKTKKKNIHITQISFGTYLCICQFDMFLYPVYTMSLITVVQQNIFMTIK